MSSWVNIVNYKTKNNSKMDKKDKDEKDKDEKVEEDNTDEIMKFYKELGYSDKETEFENKYGGDIIDVHSNLQIFSEDSLLGIYNKKSYIEFTEFVKKYSSIYHYFEDHMVTDYKSKFPDDNEDDEQSN
jgi:hypothetical protein